MKILKEKQFLNFYLDNGKMVQYNLSNGEYIGILGKPVKNLNSQLGGYSIQEVIDSFENEGYRRFLEYVYRTTSTTSCSSIPKYANLGTFLKHVSVNSSLEQYFAVGLETGLGFASRNPLKSLPKQYIKLFREGVFLKIDDQSFNLYQGYKEVITQWIPISQELNSIGTQRDFIYSNRLNDFKRLSSEYNYKMKSLIRYIDNIMTFEGLTLYDALSNLEDYLRMARLMEAKVDKYPRYLLTIHNIMVKNYNRFKLQVDEDKFKSNIKPFLEWEYEDYVFIVPRESKEIKNEGIDMSNCVASYLPRILSGETNIVFLRKKKEKQ
ncbi:MAG: PcfJ domain-containing protein, partial [Sarcina sp.]